MVRRKNSRKTVVTTLLICSIIVAVGWDLISSKKYKSETGTFRYESEFDAVTAATTKVAIVPSDYSGLSDPISRSTNPGYLQIEDMVRKAIELQGGLDWVISPGDKVMLKVNLVGGDSPSGEGENTDARVVKAVIRLIDEAMEGNVEIIVAEGTARSNDGVPDAGSVWDNSGYQDLLTDADLEGINFSFLNLNQTYEETIELTLGDKATAAPHNGKYRVHQEEIDADVFISIPVLKIHDTGITNALKNQIGTAPGSVYGYNKMNGTASHDGLFHDVDHRRWTEEEIVDLCTIADIDFVVVDAIMCLESYKTYNGSNQVRMNTIVAGADPVAVDHTCAKLFCLNPDDINHITLAEKIGLGTNDPEKIELVGAPLDDVKKRVKKNTSENGKFGQSNRTWLLSEAFTSTDISEELISGEATLEPYPGVDGWSEPVYFFDDRIDLLSYYGGLDNILTYAFTYFYAPVDQSAELWIGSHEAIRVFLNGELVYDFDGINTYGDDDIFTDREDIAIRQGTNTVMVKTLNQYNDYSFALNICEPEDDINYYGNRVEGLKFYTDSGQAPDALREQRQILTGMNTLHACPNPVSEQLRVDFELQSAGMVQVAIYDRQGKLIERLVNGELPAGKNSAVWDVRGSGAAVPAGNYFCVLRTGQGTSSIKLLVE
ncbi:MAG: DUF362 domain-containing protein [Bacteroidales bacterium]|nr:DUF362 domain-containing protein [Bacteroidales bacterium]